MRVITALRSSGGKIHTSLSRITIKLVVEHGGAAYGVVTAKRFTHTAELKAGPRDEHLAENSSW